jgi:3-mercaptopyruvate sulfurtransferase SseA
MRSLSLTVVLMLVFGFGFAPQTQFPTDPKTGRAIGAKEMTPEQLRERIVKDTKILIIDVRDPEEFENETIKGAINIPLAQLQPKLKDIPKDTTLVFT